MKKIKYFILVLVLFTLCLSQGKVFADGVTLWRDGTYLSPSASAYGAFIIPDGIGGTLIAYHSSNIDYSTSYVVRRVTTDGNIAWSQTITPILFNYSAPIDINVVSDGKGGAIIFWQNDSSGGISAQRVDVNGNLLWGQNGLSFCQYCWASNGYNIYAASDGYGGAIVITNLNYYSFIMQVQRIDGNGNKLWGENGVNINRNSGNIGHIFGGNTLTTDGLGGAIIAWVESKGWVDPYNVINYSINAQRIDPTGHILWQEGGVEAATFAAVYTHGIMSPLAIISDNVHGAIISWSYLSFDLENSIINTVNVQRIDSSGNRPWQKDGLKIGYRLSYETYYSPPAASDDVGGIIINWTDPSYRIYAQRVDINGKIKWGEGGKVLGSSEGNRYPQQNAIGGTGSKGVFAAWVGLGRGCPDTRGINIQRVDNDGNILWPESYSMVIPGGWVGAGSSFSPLSADNDEAFIFYYANSAVRAQKIVETEPLDTDGDGIPNKTDKCPCENPQEKDANKDGCTDTVCGLAEVVRSAGISNKGIETSLVSLAENACRQITDGKTIPGRNMLEAFIKEVLAQKGKNIEAKSADMLINYVNNVITGF